MTQSEITEAALGRVDPDESREARLKRMKIRSWRRGTKEMDLILGQFCDRHLADMPPQDLDRLEHLMTERDHDLLAWINADPLPEGVPDPEMITRLRDFVATAGPLARAGS